MNASGNYQAKVSNAKAGRRDLSKKSDDMRHRHHIVADYLNGGSVTDQDTQQFGPEHQGLNSRC